MEGVQGAANNIMNEIGKQFTPDFARYWQELGEIRKARYEQKQLKGKEKRVFLNEKMRDLKGLIRNEEGGIRHATNAAEIFYELIRNLAYDMHTIKMILRELYKEDKKLGQMKIPHQIEHHLEEEVIKAIRKVNGRLRTGSDMMGALIRE